MKGIEQEEWIGANQRLTDAQDERSASCGWTKIANTRRQRQPRKQDSIAKLQRSTEILVDSICR
jgi:hypothetical protein